VKNVSDVHCVAPVRTNCFLSLCLYVRFNLLGATDLAVFPLFHWGCCRKSESRWRLFGWTCVCARWQSFNWRHTWQTRVSTPILVLVRVSMHLEYRLNVYARMSKMARIKRLI